MPVVVQQSQPTASTASSQGRDVGSILAQFMRECGDRPPDPVLALVWLNDRYRQIWAAAPWNFARKDALLSVVDDITSDSVTVTNGSATVTETTSDSKWTSAVIGRYFRKTGDNQAYQISSYANANPDTLTLDRVYEGTSGTVKGYRIYQNIYSLATDVGQIEFFVDLKNQRELQRVDRAYLDAAFPNRPDPGPPLYWAPIGRDSNDIQQIELYPIPDAAFGISYRYVQEAPYITGGEAKTVPQVFEALLKAGLLSNYWSWRAAHDDATGQEQARSGYYELEFSKQLNEMVVREYQNEPQRSLELMPQYTWHRTIRGRGKFLRWDHRSQLP